MTLGRRPPAKVQEADPVGTDRDPGHAGARLVDHVEELAGGVLPEVLPGRGGVVRIDPIDFGDVRLAANEQHLGWLGFGVDRDGDVGSGTQRRTEASCPWGWDVWCLDVRRHAPARRWSTGTRSGRSAVSRPWRCRPRAAGMAEASNFLATGVSSSSRLPCGIAAGSMSAGTACPLRSGSAAVLPRAHARLVALGVGEHPARAGAASLTS